MTGKMLVRAGVLAGALACSEVGANTVIFGFEGLGDADLGPTAVFVQSGLTLILSALNNHVAGGNGSTLFSGGVPSPGAGIPGIPGIGVLTGGDSDTDVIPQRTLDSGSDDEAIEFSFDKAVSSVSIKITGAGDFELFSAELSELDGSGAYRNGTEDGDKYGDGFDEDAASTVGNDATGAALEHSGFLGSIAIDAGSGNPISVVPETVTFDFADPGAAFFLLTASDSGQGHLVLQEISVTLVPLSAALPLAGSAFALLGLWRRRSKRTVGGVQTRRSIVADSSTTAIPPPAR